MTEAELLSLREEATKIINEEKKMREWVFRSDSRKRDPKVKEMERLQQILNIFSDELTLVTEEQPEQGVLFSSPPKKATYQ